MIIMHIVYAGTYVHREIWSRISELNLCLYL